MTTWAFIGSGGIGSTVARLALAAAAASSRRRHDPRPDQGGAAG